MSTVTEPQPAAEPASNGDITLDVRPLKPSAQLVRIQQPKCQEEADALRFRQAMLAEGAQADAHTIIAATHWVMRGEEIVGYLSLEGVPLVNIWLDSKRVTPMESKAVLKQIDCLMSDRGMVQALVPCAPDSPFNPLMERMGFVRLGAADLFIRRPPR